MPERTWVDAGHLFLLDKILKEGKKTCLFLSMVAHGLLRWFEVVLRIL